MYQVSESRFGVDLTKNYHNEQMKEGRKVYSYNYIHASVVQISIRNEGRIFGVICQTFRHLLRRFMTSDSDLDTE